LFDLCVVANITIEDEFGVEIGGKFGYAVFETLAHIAESQLGALFVTGLGNAISDGSVRQNPCDQQFFAS